jgi:hypothetical protein
MTRTIHVGIDTYQAPVRPLRGCVNDIVRMDVGSHLGRV